MKITKKHLEKLVSIKREKYHPLIHKIHKKHKISKKTLFYIKEYGPHSHVAKTIIKESIKILLFTSIISSLGGLSLENIKTLFISITPLVILLPTLNNMIGSYGTIISSRFSTMLHEEKIKRKWWLNKDLKELFVQVLLISMFTTLFSGLIAILISSFYSYVINAGIIYKILIITVINTLVLVLILFLISVLGGIYIYKKHEDPNNFLIPITTSMADFGNMIILTILILLFF